MNCGRSEVAPLRAAAKRSSRFGARPDQADIGAGGGHWGRFQPPAWATANRRNQMRSLGCRLLLAVPALWLVVARGAQVDCPEIVFFGTGYACRIMRTNPPTRKYWLIHLSGPAVPSGLWCEPGL